MLDLKMLPQNKVGCVAGRPLVPVRAESVLSPGRPLATGGFAAEVSQVGVEAPHTGALPPQVHLFINLTPGGILVFPGRRPPPAPSVPSGPRWSPKDRSLPSPLSIDLGWSYPRSFMYEYVAVDVGAASFDHRLPKPPKVGPKIRVQNKGFFCFETPVL